MKRQMITVSIILLGMFTVRFLVRKDNRLLFKNRIDNIIHSMKRLNRNSTYPFMEYIGAPDQIDYRDQAQVENAKMVSEGSVYGVHYYNEKKENEHFNNYK